MDLSVIIATRNRETWLPTCLTHLEQQTFPAARFEVLVVDRASSDGTPSVVRRFASGSPVPIRLLEIGPVCLAAARNHAVDEAQGRIVLFLNDDELASPRLLQNHFETQERRDLRGSLFGAVHVHPQLPNGALTRLFLDEDAAHHAGLGGPAYLDAQMSNVSIPRRVLQRFGGYTEDPNLQGVEHIELAYRMGRDSLEAGLIDDARSYVWQPVQLEIERDRHYHIGYSLYHLLRITRSRALLHRYRLRRSRLEKFTSRFLLPHYLRACRREEQENQLFVGALYRRIIVHDRTRGFEDARNLRERRPAAGHDRPQIQPASFPT